MPNKPRSNLWTVTDPRGISVTLTDDTWEHAIQQHREVADFFLQVRQTVQDPDEIYYDAKSSASRGRGIEIFWYFKRGILSGRLKDDLLSVVVKVVLENDKRNGFVSTALPVDKPLTRLVLRWKKN